MPYLPLTGRDCRLVFGRGCSRSVDGPRAPDPPARFPAMAPRTADRIPRPRGELGRFRGECRHPQGSDAGREDLPRRARRIRSTSSKLAAATQRLQRRPRRGLGGAPAEEPVGLPFISKPTANSCVRLTSPRSVLFGSDWRSWPCMWAEEGRSQAACELEKESSTSARALVHPRLRLPRCPRNS